MGRRRRQVHTVAVGGYARAFRYRRVRGRLRLTASAFDGAVDEGRQASTSLAPVVWDQAAVPLGLREWAQHQGRDSFVALPRLSRFAVGQLRIGLEQYLSQSTNDATHRAGQMSADRPTPLGWMIFMERLDSTDDCSEDRRA